MAYRPKIKNASGTLTDLPIAAETAVKANDYNTATGTIKSKFATIDSNLGKILIGTTWYMVKETSDYTAKGADGVITILT